MAERDEIYDAIRKAHAAGDAASVKRLGDYLEAKPAPPAASTKGGFGDYIGGIARGVADFDPAGALVNLGTRATDAMGLTTGLNKQVRDVMTAGDRPSQMRSGGRVVGQMMGSVPLAAAVPAMGYGAGSAVSGGLSGALGSQADTGQDFAADVGMGAVAGAAGEGLGKMAGRMVAPELRDSVKALLARKIPLTPGQIKGGGYQRVEDAMTSVLGLGGLVQGARDRGVAAFNREAFNEALAPIGVKLPMGVNGGHKAAKFAKDTFNQAYDNVLGRMSVARDADLDTALTGLKGAAAAIPGDLTKTFDAFLAKEVAPYFGPNGAMRGADLKNIERTIRKEAMRYSRSTSGAEQAYGDLLNGLRTELREAAKRTSGPELSRALDATDAAYANYVPLRDAASKTADGTFLPGGLDTSVRIADRSAGKGAKAAGEARMQRLSSAARDVLPAKTGDSGTAQRAAATFLAGGGLAGAGVVSPLALLPPALLSLAYTKPGLRAAQALLTRGQGPKSAAIKGLLGKAGRVSAAGVPLLLQKP